MSTVPKTLQLGDILGFGLMIFTLFFGAGNLLFPPMAGQAAGYQITWASLGFLIPTVGLPIAGLLAIAEAGSLTDLLQHLPKKLGPLFGLSILILLGPAFVIPRCGVAAYEMSVRPFITGQYGTALFVTSSVFFGISFLLAINTSSITELLGKVLTPIFLILLLILILAVCIAPQGVLEAPKNEYLTAPFFSGFLQGYQTMDGLGSLVFGGFMIQLIREKGITKKKQLHYYLRCACILAAIGLTTMYVGLLWLGATSASIAPGATNGGEILLTYVNTLFGTPGAWALGLVVFLACVTTSAGLVSACAHQFADLTRWNYKCWVTIISILSVIIANLGLTKLTTFAIPWLMILYPTAIVLIVLKFFEKLSSSSAAISQPILVTTLLFSLPDACKAVGLNVPLFHYIPFSTEGFGWLIPTLLTGLISIGYTVQRRTKIQSM